MVVEGTPVEHYPDLGLWVKREDLCCPPGPHFSKTRGVYAHIANRQESVIGVLDTSHSQGGWATAQACKLLGKHCVLFYPVRKGHESDALQPQQQAAEDLGAGLVGLQAGRSAILYHRAKKELAAQTNNDSYMMPNALKLPETVEETAKEFCRTKLPKVDTIIVPSSSGTIAAGVVLGAHRADWYGLILIHLGYSRPEKAVLRYVEKMAGVPLGRCGVIDEGYSYADDAGPGLKPPFPCNAFYDLKTYRWWGEFGRKEYNSALLWNIG